MSEERFIEILEKEEIPCRYDMKLSEMKAISLAFSFGFKKGSNYGRKKQNVRV